MECCKPNTLHDNIVFTRLLRNNRFILSCLLGEDICLILRPDLAMVVNAVRFLFFTGWFLK